jgi:hypothetical protein
MPALESALLNNASGQGAAVWEWLKTQDATEATTSLKRNVLNFAGYQDPELALRLATELPRTPQGDAQTQELARCLLNGGNMLNRFERLYEQAPERLRQPLVEAAFHFLGGTELTEPQLWVTRLALLPEASRTQGIESIARAWTQQNPEEAIGWTTSLPAGETRERAVAAIASAWAAKDPHNAGAWVEAMPAGGERERSAVSLASALAERYPQDAWNWALSVNDPAERLRAATQAAKGIASRDAALARKWIDAAPLAPEVKAGLQAVVGQARLSPGRR